MKPRSESWGWIALAVSLTAAVLVARPRPAPAPPPWQAWVGNAGLGHAATPEWGMHAFDARSSPRPSSEVGPLLGHPAADPTQYAQR